MGQIVEEHLLVSCHGDMREGVPEEGRLELISTEQLGGIKRRRWTEDRGRDILWEMGGLKHRSLKTCPS